MLKMIGWPHLKWVRIRIVICVILILLIFSYNIIFLSNKSQFFTKELKSKSIFLSNKSQFFTKELKSKSIFHNKSQFFTEELKPKSIFHNKSQFFTEELKPKSIQISNHPFQNSLIYCYFDRQHSDSLLELDPIEVTKNSIFFIETSCSHTFGIELDLRQACAIESAAKLNPNLKIFVLFVSASFINYESEVYNILNTYENINFRTLNLIKYSYNTPAHKFVTSNKIFTSKWPVYHTSDLLRYLTLWKFGGTYLDLDVILMKSLEGITNFASAESNTSIASFILNFGNDDIGKTMANTSLNDFVANYRGYDWGYNGPGVITRTLKTICNTDSINAMNMQMCKGFTVFKPEVFCPISWSDWQLYFDKNNSEKVMTKVKDSIGIHLWNKLTRNINIMVGSKQPLGLIAQKYCLKIFSSTKYVF